jgi:hydrogenase/urease accessory protein HupE
VWYLFVPLALAHPIGVSQARFADGSVTLTFSEAELGEVAPTADLDASRIVLRQLTLDAVRVTADGAPCTIGEATLTRVSSDGAADGVAINAPVDCPSGDAWVYQAGFFDTLRPGHRHYVEQDGNAVGVLDTSTRTAELSVRSDPWRVARRFLILGVEHIWTGFDHLLFLLGLLLVSTRIRDMLLVVTGFTAAHSITLGAAALGWVTLPSVLVEAGIAASIVYVGFENLWTPPPWRRLMVTFGLGLLHGFGFAGLLTDIGLPHDALVLALVSFNAGVELGQALLALPVLPLLLLLRRSAWWSDRGVPVLSLAVAAAGTAWLVERLLAAW